MPVLSRGTTFKLNIIWPDCPCKDGKKILVALNVFIFVFLRFFAHNIFFNILFLLLFPEGVF